MIVNRLDNKPVPVLHKILFESQQKKRYTELLDQNYFYLVVNLHKEYEKDCENMKIL